MPPHQRQSAAYPAQSLQVSGFDRTVAAHARESIHLKPVQTPKPQQAEGRFAGTRSARASRDSIPRYPTQRLPEWVRSDRRLKTRVGFSSLKCPPHFKRLYGEGGGYRIHVRRQNAAAL